MQVIAREIQFFVDNLAHLLIREVHFFEVFKISVLMRV